MLSFQWSQFFITLFVTFCLSLRYPGAESRKPALVSKLIDEVNTKQLETLIDKSDRLVVFFYTRSCVQCKSILEELEKISVEVKNYGVGMIKTSERAASKRLNINELPKLAFFNKKEMLLYEGNLMRSEDIFEWLSSSKSLDLPNRIEQVSSKYLQHFIDSNDYIAVLFSQNNCKKCDKVLQKLEEIDDDAAQENIQFVQILDQTLANEYGLETIPALVYYRRKIPIVYQNDLEDSEAVLQWLLKFRDTANAEDDDDDDDEAIIEDVNDQVLKQLIESTSFLAVLFYDDTQAKSQHVLEELENIDDETDEHGIAFVKINDRQIAKQFGLDAHEIPCLVYFENKIPNFYVGDLTQEEEVLEWLIHQKNSDEIEEVSDIVLDQLIKSHEHIVVLFYDKESDECLEVLKELENIDDNCDQLGLLFVKIDDDQLALKYGLENQLPALVYFENEIPYLYEDDLRKEEKVFLWLKKQMTQDEIEEVTDKMLDLLIEKLPHVAVYFYNSKNKKSAEILKELEHIDDDCDQVKINFVKTDDTKAAIKYNVEDKLPAIVFFENKVPILYEGDPYDEDKLLKWLIEQQASVEIEEVNSATLSSLIENTKSIAVLFYDKDSATSVSVLKDLENIDDDTDRYDIPLAKIDDDKMAKKYGVLDELPILVYFENKLPTVYEGDLHDEEVVLEWLIKQKNEDTIEEVTEEILQDLIAEHPYVLVFYAPDKCKECEHILEQFENIDDDTDDHGILFVTTDDQLFAKKAGITKFPALVFYRNGEPLTYQGDLKRPEKVLKWVTSEEALELPDKIEQFNKKLLDKLLDRSSYVAVLFLKPKNCPECEKVLQELEKIDHIAESNDIEFVQIVDVKVAAEYNVFTFPTLIFFKKRFRQIYEGDMKDEEEVLAWLIDSKGSKEDVIELVDRKMLDMLIEEVNHIVVFFYDEDNCQDCELILDELENIDDDTDRHGIHFVKSKDIMHAKDLGIDDFPALIYFENGNPSIYTEDLTEEDQILEWLIQQKNDDTIENLNREMLFRMILQKDYLAALFYKKGDDESDEILEHLENIDDDCDEFGIHLVKINDNLIAKKYGIRNPPGLIFFRRGKPLKYNGDLFDEEEVLEWLTKHENMESKDVIEKVNRRMFERLLGRINYLSVVFYSKDDCKQCERVLEELEKIDDEADTAGIKLIKIEDSKLAKNYGVFALPGLLFFKRGEENDPVIYAGDLKNSDRILEWLISQKDPSLDTIEDVDGPSLRKLIKSQDHLAVYLYSENCSECDKVINDLENIDTETDKHGIAFVKTADTSIASEYGCKAFPALIYFKKQMPNIYQADLSEEEDVLHWIIQQKTDDTIESVNRELLEQLIEKSHYLVVYFYKPYCRVCETVLEELEHIDDECDIYGIHMVKIQDIPLAKRYGIRTFPALMYFRNGNPLLFEGELRNEESVLEWLLDDDNRELEDEIEDVNARMLDKLVDESPFLVAFFYEDDCQECEEVLEKLENIDDDLDRYGIDFVKVNDPQAASKWRVHHVPALGYFRKKVPVFYDQDLLQEDKILAWLTSDDVFELKDEIEEVNRKMLEKILNENDFVSVYFYENDCDECEEVLKELERIDDDADDLDIMFVKIKDTRFSRKYGITKVPALAFFRKRFPSMYRGDLRKEEEVLEWLRKNRYRQPEISIFMWCVIAVTFGFIFYTMLLVFFIKPKSKKE